MKATFRRLFLVIVTLGVVMPTMAQKVTGRTIDVYARVVKLVSQSNTEAPKKVLVTDKKVYFHVWKTRRDDTQKKDLPTVDLQSGFGNDKVAPNTADLGTTLGTWAHYQFTNVDSTTTASEDATEGSGDNAVEVKSGDTIHNWYNLIVAIYDNTGTNCLYQTIDMGDFNALSNNEIFFELEEDVGKDGNVTFSFNEQNRYQAEGKQMAVYLCDANGNHVAQFASVRNQTVQKGVYDDGTPLPVIGHYRSNTLYSLGIPQALMPEKWTVQLGYNTTETTTKDNELKTTTKFTPLRYYYPGTDYDFSTNAPDWAYKTNDENVLGGYANYDNCEHMAAGTTYFSVGTPDADDVSYTLYLNIADLFDGWYETHQGALQTKTENDEEVKKLYYDKNTNVSVNYFKKYGRNSIGIQRNKQLDDDSNGFYLMSNMVKIRPEDNYENQEGTTDAWDPTDNSRPMTKITNDNKAKYTASLNTLKTAGYYNDGDVVYVYNVQKPQDTFSSMFMAFRPGSATGANFSWAKVIRPQVQEGKTATATFGSLFRPVKNAMEALTPDLADNNVTQFEVFINLSQSTYAIIPRASYDLTGPAVVYFNPSANNGQGDWETGSAAEQWGNGQYQYHYTAMAYNPTENCYQYTGRFRKSICLNEDGTDGDGINAGFRFRVNQLYTTNYHEELYWLDDSHLKNTNVASEYHDALTYKQYANSAKAVSESTAITTTRPMPTETPGWVYANGSHNPYGPDTYYYNHVQICTPGGATWDDAKKGKHTLTKVWQGNDKTVSDENARDNLNFDLDDGYYTIKFYPQGDVTGKPYYTLEPAQDPGTEVPETKDRRYNYLRTYSSPVAYLRPADMDVYVVAKKEGDNVLLKSINSLGYLPANTGLIIGYNADITTSNPDSLKKLEYSTSFSETQYTMIANLHPSLNLTRYDGTSTTDYLYGENNLLKPTTYFDSDGKLVNVSAIEPYELQNGTTDKVARRNYNFFLRTKSKVVDGVRKYSECHLSFLQIKKYQAGDVVGKTTIDEATATKYNTPAKERAYLCLTAAQSGGKALGENDKAANPTGSSAKLAYYDATFDGAITDISTLRTQQPVGIYADPAYYTLQGTRVNRPAAPGIYIHSGKKIIIK